MGELIGTMAGSYRIVARLGAGGMGEVYEGIHTTLLQSAAIKVLHASAGGQHAAHQRFFIEVQAVVRITHDGVVRVWDLGKLEDGRPYLVMELLDGRSLHELNKHSRLSITDACRIVADVLDALDAAHAVGVVHRDLKPPNIFRTRSGRTVVVDFGIAKLLELDTPPPLTTADTAAETSPPGPGTTHALTRAGTAVGTPYYMAPEQIRGLPVTPAVDIYAAGVVLFELLCRRRPFEGAEEDILLGHLERRPPPPRALEPSIPLPVQDVILTALAKDPEKRHASAAVMRDRLRAAIDYNEAVATPIPSPPTTEPMPHTPAADTAATVRDSPAARAPRVSPPDVIATAAAPDIGACELASSAPTTPRSHRAGWLVAGAAVVAASVSAIVHKHCSSSAVTPAERAKKERSPAELIAALHSVASWNELDADMRAVIERLASGATNRLSTRARRYLLQVVDGDLSPELQGMMLRDTLTAGAASIAIVDEELTLPATKFILEGPVAAPSYAFRGKVADAERWSARFADGTTVPVIAATAVPAGARMYTVRQAVESAAYLPASARSRVRALVLNPAADPDDAYWAEAFHDKSMSAHMTADASGELTIYPMPETSTQATVLALAGQMLHETGHIWSQQQWGIETTTGRWSDWQRAIDADRIAVSRYARKSIQEDLAETVQIYAGLVGSQRLEEYRALVPHRFAILDRSYPQR